MPTAADSLAKRLEKSKNTRGVMSKTKKSLTDEERFQMGIANALFISLVVFAYAEAWEGALNGGNEVIEVPVKTQIVKHQVSGNSSSVKLKCNIFKDFFNRNKIMSVNEFRWERKKCGYGLNLDNCGNYKRMPWTPATCKNGSKFCDGYTLKFDNPTINDSGYYRCLYKSYMSKQYKVYKMFYLDIYDPESTFEILEEPKCFDNKIVYVNETVVFRCRARSLSPLHMIWAKLAVPEFNDSRVIQYGVHTYQLLNGGDTHNIVNDLYISKLAVPNCQIEDSGQYYCFIISINNSRLLKNKSVSLTVISPRANKGHTLPYLGIVEFILLGIFRYVPFL